MKFRFLILSFVLAGCSTNSGSSGVNPADPVHPTTQTLSCDEAKSRLVGLGPMNETDFMKAVVQLPMPEGSALEDLSRCLDAQLSIRCNGQICEAKDL